MTQSRLVSNVFLVHEPGKGEIMKALRCPLFGTSHPVDDDIESTPSYWRSEAHFQRVWDRSPS